MRAIPPAHLHVGGNVVNFGPVSGAPNISDREGGRRYGDLEGFRNILRLTHALGILHWQGGIVVEPVDVPVPTRHLEIFQAHIEYSDIVWAARGVGGDAGARTRSRCPPSSTAARSRSWPSGRRC